MKRIITQSEVVLEKRKKEIIEKQEAILERIEKQKKLNKQKEELRKAEYTLKNELKQMKSLHKIKKDEFRYHTIREKLAFDDEKIAKFQLNKDDMIKKRLDNQTVSQFQRELVRETLHQMAVWNVVDVEVAENIVKDPYNTFIGPTPSELVRRKVRKNDNRTSNTMINFAKNKNVTSSFALDEIKKNQNITEPEISKEEITPLKQSEIEVKPPETSNQIVEKEDQVKVKTYQLFGEQRISDLDKAKVSSEEKKENTPNNSYDIDEEIKHIDLKEES